MKKNTNGASWLEAANCAHPLLVLKGYYTKVVNGGGKSNAHATLVYSCIAYKYCSKMGGDVQHEGGFYGNRGFWSRCASNARE